MKPNGKQNSKRNIRVTAAVLCVMMVCAVLAGCMNTANDGTRTPQFEATQLPEMSFTPQNTQQIRTEDRAAVEEKFDWRQNVYQIESRIGMISEIQTARIVVNEGTALVGIVFEPTYQGELTQRIHDMVAAEVQSVDPAVQTVAVTAEAQDVEKITQIADRIAAGTPVEEMSGEIDGIVRNMTTIQ